MENENAVRRLALVLAIEIEIEGMKVTNLERISKGETAAYNEEDFIDKAEDLRNLAYAHEQQLFG